MNLEELRAKYSLNKTFFYFSGEPGTGKTETIINESIKEAKNQKKIAIAFPGKQGCREVSERILQKDKNIKVSLITTDTHERVTSTLIDHFQNVNPDEGEILIITHSAFQNIPFWPFKNLWTLFHDESFDTTRHFELNLSKNKTFITKFCSIADLFQKFPLIKIKKIAELKERIKNKTDDQIYSDLRDFHQTLLNANEGKALCFSHNIYNKEFLHGLGKKFVMTALTTPKQFEGFEKVIVSGANFEESLMFHCWNKLFGITWEESNLKNNLRNLERKSKIEFHILSERNWTQNLKGKQVNNQSVSDFYYELISGAIDNEINPVLLLKNEKDKIPFKNFIECPFNNMGLNHFDKMTTFVYSGSFNKAPSFYSFIKHFGLEVEAKKCLTSEHFFQSLYRTAYRRPDFEGTIKVFTPSLQLIEPIRGRFQNYEIKFHTENFDEKFKEQLGFGKKGRPNEKNSIASNEELKVVSQFFKDKKRKLKKKPKTLLEDTETTISFTLYSKPKPKESGEYFWPTIGLKRELSVQDFFGILLNESESRVVMNKFDNFLVSLATFNQEEENNRRRENIEKIYGQFLDFDTPNDQEAFSTEKFQSLFGEIACLCFPTFSGGSRRRLVYLFDKPLSMNLAQKIYDEVFERISKAYPNCKLDPKSKELQTIYFMPSKVNGIFEDVKNGALMETDKFIALDCKLGLTEEQLSQRPMEIDQVSFGHWNKVEEKIYSMAEGNHFNLGQEAIGLCKKYCPEERGKLFTLLESKGVSKAHLNDFNRLWAM